MGYPLFQSTLKSSTPFPGTMADTSTPTPADGAQEQVSPYASPQAGVQVDEQKNEAARQERIKLLTQQRDALLADMKAVQNLQWVGNTKKYARLGPERYKRWQETAMNGTREIEPYEAMKERLNIIERMRTTAVGLQEQIRLESLPGPLESEYLKERGQDIANQEDIDVRLKRWEEVNRTLPDDMKLPPDTLLLLSQNPTASTQGRYGTIKNDPIERLTAGAELGAKAGREVGDDPSIPEPLRNAVRLGADQDKKKRDEKDKEDSAPLPVLGLYKYPKELQAAMLKDYQDMLNTDGYFHMEKYTDRVPSQIPGQFVDVPKERKRWSKEEKKDARAAVAVRYPGYEKYLPNFVEKGFTDVPDTSSSGDQKDVDVQATRARLKAQAQAK